MSSFLSLLTGLHHVSSVMPISRCYNLKIIPSIRNNLKGQNLERFKKSCFGRLLDIKIEKLNYQWQILSHLLWNVDQNASKKKNKLVFKINNSEIIFGPEEFSYITGLRIGPLGTRDVTASSPPSIYNEVFVGRRSIMLSDVRDAFLCHEGNGEVKFKLALLYFLYGILIPTKSIKNLDLQYFNLIENLNEFNKFPWGQVGYEFLFSSFLSTRGLLKTESKLKLLRGFSVALQVWAYELIPSLANHCAVRLHNLKNLTPSILLWSTRYVSSNDFQKFCTLGDEAHLEDDTAEDITITVTDTDDDDDETSNGDQVHGESSKARNKSQNIGPKVVPESSDDSGTDIENVTEQVNRGDAAASDKSESARAPFSRRSSRRRQQVCYNESDDDDYARPVKRVHTTKNRGRKALLESSDGSDIEDVTEQFSQKSVRRCEKKISSAQIVGGQREEPGSRPLWNLETSISSMDCKKAEAMRAKEMAEKHMKSSDFAAAQKFVLEARNLCPELENITQMLSICDVYCSAQKRLPGVDKDWYEVLQVEILADESTIKKQYRRLALILHPDKNRFLGAEGAFKLITEANALLSDPAKKSVYDNKIKEREHKSLNFGSGRRHKIVVST